MKVRKLLSWVPLILMLAAAVVLAFSYLHVKKTIVAKLSGKATGFLGQDVSIQDISFDFPAIINLYGLSVKNPEGFPPGELLRLKRVHMNLRLLPLLKGRLSLRNLVAFSPEVEIIKNAHNRLNVSDVLMRNFSQESSSQTKFEIDLFEVDSGSFQFNREVPFTFRDINFSLEPLSSGARVPTEVKGTVIYLGNTIQIEGSVDRRGKSPQINLRVSSKDVTLSALGRYLSPYRIDTERTRWDVALNLEGDLEESVRVRSEIRQVRGEEIFQFAPSPKNVRCHVEGTFSPSRGSLAVHKGLLEAEGLSARFSGTWANLKTSPSYQLETQIDRLDLSKFNFGKELKIGGILNSGSVRWKGTFQNPLPEASGMVQVKDGEVRTAQAILENIQGVLEFSSSKGWKVQGEASARIAKAGSLFPSLIPAKNIQLHVTGIVDQSLESLRVQAGTLEAEGFTGRFSGRLSNLKKIPVYEIDMQVDRLNLSQFNPIKDLEVSGAVTSRLLRLRGDVRTGMPQASGVLQWRNGAIQCPQAHVGKLSADLDFSWAEELRARADVVAEIAEVAGHPMDKPVGARLSGSVQGTERQMTLASSLSLSPLEVRLKDGLSLSLGKSVLKTEGTIRESSFSGKHSFELDDMRYAGHVFRGVRGKSVVGFQKGATHLSGVEIQSEETGMRIAQARIVRVKPGEVYEIDLQDMSVRHRGDEMVLEKCDAHSTIRLQDKTRLVDLRFSIGTLGVHGFPLRRITGTGKSDEKTFSLEVFQGEVAGGGIRLSAHGRMSEGPFPVKVKAIAEGMDLSSHPEALRKFLEPPYLLGGKIERLRYDGTIQRRDSLEGQIFLEARQISFSDQKAKRNILKDASLDAKMDCRGKDLLIQAETKIGDVSAHLSGTVTGVLEKGRRARVQISLPETEVTKIRETFWDIVPDGLLYTGLEGSLSAALSMDYADPDWSLEALVRMNQCMLRGENGEYVVGPIQGALPVRYSRKGQKEQALSFPSFEKSRFDSLLKTYSEEAPEQGSHTITVGGLQYGFPLLEKIRLHVSAGDNILNAIRFDANIFGGSLRGAAVLDLSQGLSYRGGLLIKGISLTALCDGIKPIQGFISGKVNGIGSFKGSGAGLQGLMGRAEFWADSKADEKMRISREFLERIGGPTAKLYLGERRFDTGVMDVYFLDGYLIFKELELSNRNFLGMTDLSVKVAPLSNRIALDHLLWTITEAAARAEEKK
jgi:hypothetical protein